MAKGKNSWACPQNIQAVRIVELPFITVSRTQDEGSAFPRTYCGSLKNEIFGCLPAHCLHRRIETEQFVHG